MRRPSPLLALFPSWPRRCSSLWDVNICRQNPGCPEINVYLYLTNDDFLYDLYHIPKHQILNRIQRSDDATPFRQANANSAIAAIQRSADGPPPPVKPLNPPTTRNVIPRQPPHTATTSTTRERQPSSQRPSAPTNHKKSTPGDPTQPPEMLPTSSNITHKSLTNNLTTLSNHQKRMRIHFINKPL